MRINKLTFCMLPKKLALRHDKGYDFVGWVWMQRAYLSYNLNHGWIAFADDQLKAHLMNPLPCEKCGRK